MLKALLRWLHGYPSASPQTTVSRNGERESSEHAGRPQCSLCGRVLENPEDELSLDCGGDCWGCIGEIEADMGDESSLVKVREESRRGLRPGWVAGRNGSRGARGTDA